MAYNGIMTAKHFSPWVFVTYGCSCACPYCMIPQMETQAKSMSPENFRKMLETTEKLFDQGEYESASFRLSGGEPLLVFNNYQDIVSEYRKKYDKRKMGFGLLSNFVNFTDEIAAWMEENQVGIQVSLDDLENGKPLNDGSSSSPLVLENIEKLKKYQIGFSFNTVLDTNRTKDLTKLADYICTFPNVEWGLNESYTETDTAKVNEVIGIFDECIKELVKNGFDIRRKLRFYNTIVGTGRGGCSAGVNSFAIGTNLELWSCQSLCDKKPLGYFDENVKQTLLSAPDNEYFRERRLLSECADCQVLGSCRGGCRATHQNKEIADAVCQIRRTILSRIASGYYGNNRRTTVNTSDTRNSQNARQASALPPAPVV